MKLYLSPGDTLLYRPQGLFGFFIAAKTWHKIAHVEVYDGQKQSLASRDGIGVGRYPVRLSQLAYVLRPRRRLDLAAGRAWFDTMNGKPYGWLDLVSFVGLPAIAPGIVCSPFAAGFYRASGWNVFPVDPIEKVAPFQFLDLVGQDYQVVYSPESLAGLVPTSISSLS
jgi:hypothetical protein